MNFVLIVLNFFYINFLFSGTYKVEAYMDTTVSGETKLPDNRTYRTFSLDGMWKDSLGDIGIIKAFGKVESLSGEPNLEVMAIQTNEDGNRLWGVYRRDSTDVKIGGGGSSRFVAGTGKYQFLVGYECKFVARYIKNRNFTVIKCDIPDKVLSKIIEFNDR